MLTQSEIREIYERKVKTYSKTGSDQALGAIFVLEEILGISSKETDELLLKLALDKQF